MTTRLRVVTALAILAGASFALTGVLLPAVTASRALAQDQAPAAIPAPTAAPAVSAASSGPAALPTPPVPPAAPALALPATVAVQATQPASALPPVQPPFPEPARAGNLYAPADVARFGGRGRGPQPWPTLDPEDAAEAQRLALDDAKLEGEVRSAVGQYHAAEKEADRNKLRAQLTDLLEKQFAARQERRKLELASLEGRVKKLREALEKRESAKQTIVERRLGDLLGDEDGLGWGDGGFGGQVFPFQPVGVDLLQSR